MKSEGLLPYINNHPNCKLNIEESVYKVGDKVRITKNLCVADIENESVGKIEIIK